MIVDSPIIQRLRGIKQLGLVDYLYPTASHTRFTHTLGVIHTASTIYKRIFHELSANTMTFDEDEGLQVLRLAAIFHDIGHFFGSHAAEFFFQDRSCNYSRWKLVDKIRSHFSLKLQIKPSLTEIIAVIALFTKDIQQLLNNVSPGLNTIQFRTSKEKEDTLEKIACLILGYPYNQDWIPFAQIVNGQVDADKIDYITRDSFFTGLPTSLDFSRFIQKIRVIRSDKELRLIANSPKDGFKYYQFGVSPSAINAVDQLILSKFLLFENVYFHQKTLGSESFLRQALEEIDKSTDGLLNNFTQALLLTDTDVVTSNLDMTIERVGDVEVTNEEKFKAARAICKKIYLRDLLKRCVVLSSDSVNFEDPNRMETYNKIVENNYRDLEVDIREKTTSICQKLKIPSPVYILLVKQPPLSSISLESNLPIALADNKKNFDRNYKFETDNWIKSRLSRTNQISVLSEPDNKYIVYLATELMLYEKYKALLDNNDLFTDSDELIIEELRGKLTQKNEYKHALPLLRLKEVNERNSVFQRCIEKWNGYERFDRVKGERIAINSTHINSFAHQFYRYQKSLKNFEVFVDGFCDILDNICVVKESQILESLKSNINEILSDRQLSNQPLLISMGSLNDSSSRISHSVTSLNAHLNTNFHPLLASELNAAMLTNVEQVVFIDDAYYSGTQLITYFQTLAGVEKSKRLTGEEHVAPLQTEVLGVLKEKKVYLSFLYGNGNATRQLEQSIKELGFKNVNIYAYRDFPSPCFKDSDTNERTNITKLYFEAASRDILSHSKRSGRTYSENWNKDRIEKSLLGYNDAQQLIVYSWNTPTFTLTPLWLSVYSPSYSWQSMFPRINKP